MTRKNEYIDALAKVIGLKIRSARLDMGMPRTKLGELIDVSHQQVRKYERGFNNISFGRLFLISQTLGKDISYFYEGITNSKSETDALTYIDQRMLSNVTRNFMNIENVKQQKSIATLIKSLTKVA